MRMMTLEESITKVESIVRNGYSVDQWEELNSLFLSMAQPPKPFPESPTHEQYMRLYKLGVELHIQGHPGLAARGRSTSVQIASLLLLLHYIQPTEIKFALGFSIGKDKSMNTIIQMIGDVVEKVTDEDESLSFFEVCSTEIGGFNRRRNGYIVLTDKRLFMIGSEFIPTKTYAERYYLWYPDLSKKSYYGSLDYVPLDKIVDARVRYGRMDKKLVVRLKDIDYMKVKPRHLYGPLFFKTQLSDKVKIGHGKFQLAIRLPQLEGESKDEHKARYERLERLLLTR